MVQLFYDIYSAQKHTVTFEVFFTGNQNITVSPYCFRLFAHTEMPRPRHVGSFCAFSAPKHVRRKTEKHKNQMEKKNATCLIPLTPPGEKHKSPRAHRKKAKTRDTETEKTLRRLLRRVRIAHKQHKRTEDGSVSSKPGSENLRFLVAEREKKKKRPATTKRKKVKMTYAVTERAQTYVRDDGPAPMDVEDDSCARPSSSALSEDPTRDIILAAYRGDVARAKFVLQHCETGVVANMSLKRAAAVELLGEHVYLGSHSWSSQEGFPVMYFAGECAAVFVRGAPGSPEDGDRPG